VSLIFSLSRIHQLNQQLIIKHHRLEHLFWHRIQVFTIPVTAGDVIIAGTDGLFDNLYNNEVTAVVVHAVRAGLEPQVTAQKIAALARQRAQDRNRQTPFSTAAQDAGFRYYGGKLDDITVVVSYITSPAGL
jgi:protein phosphatase PTC7